MNNAICKHTLFAAAITLSLAACSQGGSPASPDSSGGRASNSGFGHTAHSIDLDDGRSIVIPEDVVQMREGFRGPVVNQEWVQNTFSPEDAVAIQAACGRENRRLIKEAQSYAQVPYPLLSLCTYVNPIANRHLRRR